MHNVNLTIDGIPVTVPENYTVLQAAKVAGVTIPTLCYLEGINSPASCRVCVVKVDINGKPMRNLPASCVLQVADGMNVQTNTPEVKNAVKNNVELLLASHNRECLICSRNQTCELQRLCRELGIKDIPYDNGNEKKENRIDDLSPSIVRDPSKCILCGRCVSTCKNVQGIGALDFTNRGIETKVSPAFDYSLNDANCIYCGQCIEACPVGALSERSNTEQVLAAIHDPKVSVFVQTAPAVRVALGEEFDLPIGTAVTGKMTAALRRLGFDKVFDTNFSADLTIMEESAELLDRLNNGGPLPMITSCSPGWIRFCELNYPEFLPNLSTCKSPQQMFGAIAKSYYAEKCKIDPKQIVSVSIMPCVSKKSEISRPEMEVHGLRDVDYTLTTRELAAMIREAGIRFRELPDEKPDSILGEGTGAGVIFGATGGVMEAALRTASDILTGEDLQDIEYHEVRGLEGIKTATISLPVHGKAMDIKVAVAHGTANAAKLLDAIKAGTITVQFVEVMACPGGCVNGGGQPIVSSQKRSEIDPKKARAEALYQEDLKLPHRKSHENSEVQTLYREYLGQPLSPKAHELLHTVYTPKTSYPQ